MRITQKLLESLANAGVKTLTISEEAKLLLEISQLEADGSFNKMNKKVKDFKSMFSLKDDEWIDKIYWLCNKNLRMKNTNKDIAFTKGKIYLQSTDSDTNLIFKDNFDENHGVSGVWDKFFTRITKK